MRILPFRLSVASVAPLGLVLAMGCSTTEGTDVPIDEDTGIDELDTAPRPDTAVPGDSTPADGSDTRDATVLDTLGVDTADGTIVDSGALDTAGLDVTPGDAIPDTSPSTCTDGGDAGTTDAGTFPGPVLEKTGVAGKVLLKGMVITPDVAFAGEVLVEGDIITCVAASCAASAGAATASVVQTNGVILPGMIDGHNHILFNIMDETDWAPIKSYMNHNQWTAEPRYSAMVDTKQYLNGEGSTADLGCEMDKYGELKGLVAGTTSIVGAANSTNRACYGTLARTVDQTPNGGLGPDKIQVATLFPTAAAASGVCGNFTDGSTDAYLIHIAEGIDTTALNEFAKLGTITTVAPATPGCLYAPKTTIVHGTALGTTELTTMGTAGMGLVWSPRSNVFLYGGGIDLTKTTNIPVALSKGINVSIGPDWSMGGSQNMLDELRFADKVDNASWGNILTPKMLVQMATINGAKNLGL
ncbi:MAG: amidohydrolase family protein, partial [Polyangiales bacterium]